MKTPAGIYARAVRSSLRRSSADSLPRTELQTTTAIDPDDLAAYSRVCGYALGNALPPTYPHVLAFADALRIQTDPAFPFPAVGTVHVSQEVTVHRAIAVTETLELRTAAVDLRPHPRGRQYDMVTTASVAGEDVWEGRSTYLRRESSTASSGDASSERPTPPEATAVWRLPADLGRRYAAVSGDRNPIHLYRATARIFGFRRQIAHGMWTFAACLATLEGRLPSPYSVRAEFKRPVFLPGKVDFAASPSATGWEFSLHHHSRPRPHLLGRVTK